MGEKIWTDTIKSGLTDRMLNIFQVDQRYSYRDRPAKKSRVRILEVEGYFMRYKQLNVVGLFLLSD